MSDPERLTDAIMAAIAEDIQRGVMLSDARVRGKVLAILHAEAGRAPQPGTVTILRHVYGDLLYAQGELASIEALVSERGEVGVYAKVDAVLREASPAPSPAGAETLERLVKKWRADAIHIESEGDFCCALTRRHDADDLEAALRAAPSPAAEMPREQNRAERYRANTLGADPALSKNTARVSAPQGAREEHES